MFFIFVASLLFADITVQYTPSSYLYFTRGSMPFAQNDFVAKLGTLVFTNPDGDIIEDPMLLTFHGDMRFRFEGRMDNGVESSEFRLASTWGESSGQWRYLDNQNSHLMVENMELTNSTYSMGIYLISTQGANRYFEGEIYTWKSGIFGAFNLQIQDEDDQNNNIYVPVNGQEIEDGQTPSTTTSFLQPGETIPENPIPYGDPIEQVDYLLSIIQEQSFPIESAYDGPPVEVAKAQLMLQNATVGIPYEVIITFRNEQNSPNFHLHLNNDAELYAIPYTLLFGTRGVTGGIPLTWEDLVPHENTMPLFITGIDRTQAEAAIAGSYVDTIWVEITANDN